MEYQEITNLYRRIGRDFRGFGADKVQLLKSKKLQEGPYEMEMTIVVSGCSTAEAMRTYAQKKWSNIKMDIWLEQDLMMSCREELIEDGILL